MKIALIDLKESVRGCNNKDVAGTFGNAMRGEGLASWIFGFMKRQNVRMPVVHLGYLASIFRSHGHEVRFYDGAPREKEELVIMASSLVGHEEELGFARKIKEGYPDRRVGFFGAFATVEPETFLEGGADFVIKGEPEGAAMEMAKDGLDAKGVMESRLIFDLDRLPNPDWHYFPVDSFRYFPALKKPPVVPVLGSRGCSFDCHYCPYMVVQTERWRARDPKGVVDEMVQLKKDFDIKSVAFRDIIFSIQKKRTAQLCEEILRRGLNIEWSCETRTDCLDEELLTLMHRAGLRSIHFGIESPNDEIVKKSGRHPIKETHQVKMIRHAEQLGIQVLAFYIIGFVEDTQETILNTIRFAKRLNTSVAQFDIMTPYPGTKFFSQIESEITSTDWKEFTTYHPVVRLKHLKPEDLLRLKQKAYRSYYFRPRWVLKNAIPVFLG